MPAGAGASPTPSSFFAAAVSAVYSFVMLVDRRSDEDAAFLGASAARESVGRNAQSIRSAGFAPPSFTISTREHARGFDVGRIVQQHQRLQRRVRSRADRGAFLARRRVERHQARMQERPLPPRVQPAAILILAVIVRPFARREIQIAPNSRPVDRA